MADARNPRGTLRSPVGDQVEVATANEFVEVSGAPLMFAVAEITSPPNARGIWTARAQEPLHYFKIG